MKKYVVLFCSLFISAICFSQSLDLGIKAGVNFSNLTDASNLTNKTGFVVGAFVGGKLGDKFGIQGDLLYSAQGANSDDPTFEDLDLNYVNVPVVLKYFISDTFHVHAGPQFGFIVDDNISNVFNNIAEAEGFDLTGVLGLGLDLPMGIRIDGRYNFGLSNTIKVNNPNVTLNEPGRNTVFTLSVGYSFL